jgi:hypothetical protein
MAQKIYNGLRADGKYAIGGYVNDGKSEGFVAVYESTLTMDLQSFRDFLHMSITRDDHDFRLCLTNSPNEAKTGPSTTTTGTVAVWGNNLSRLLLYRTSFSASRYDNVF